VARGPFPSVGPVTVEDGWEVSRRSGGDLNVADLSRLGKWSVRAAPGSAGRADLPPPWTTRRSGADLVCAAATGEWLILTPPGAPAGIEPDADILSVVDITHGRAMLRLTGARARAVLGTLCGVDLANAAVPDARSLRGYVGKIVTDIVRDDVDGRLSYILHCERSAGRSLLDSVLDAGTGDGIVFTGDGGNRP
jgi:heterotetrameric sarcosine oxidase gamma subunit